MVAERMESNSVDGSVMSIVMLNKFSQSSIPNLDSSINCWSSDTSAIWGELATENFRFMFGESSRDGCFCDIPELDTTIVWATQEKSLIEGDLTFSDPIGVSYEALFEFAVHIPHFDGFIGRTAH